MQSAGKSLRRHLHRASGGSTERRGPSHQEGQVAPWSRGYLEGRCWQWEQGWPSQRWDSAEVRGDEWAQHLKTETLEAGQLGHRAQEAETWPGSVTVRPSVLE